MGRQIQITIEYFMKIFKLIVSIKYTFFFTCLQSLNVWGRGCLGYGNNTLKIISFSLLIVLFDILFCINAYLLGHIKTRFIQTPFASEKGK
jgi:hypothetical protein